ncbi:hypothetical protein ATANTOWER_022856 [Ataeniobius toweri]|uniref:Uncharacterized protein n=1 Tax=Ataeniobius toweri TaxID=208326 RepID=A0ABU7AJD7_9TELE|nr:hypothetical protein [Ataeniobius toweri]
MFSIVSSIAERIFISTPLSRRSLPLPDVALSRTPFPINFQRFQSHAIDCSCFLCGQSSMVLKDRHTQKKKTAPPKNLSSVCGVCLRLPRITLTLQHLLLYPKR